MPVLEEKVFEKAVIDLSKLKAYGFRHEGDSYLYDRLFMNGDFRAVIRINAKGKVSGEVYDTASESVYLPLRVEEMSVGFAGQVRAEYIGILEDIKAHCCKFNLFVFGQTNRISEKIFEVYGDRPDFPWEKYSDCGVFRNPQTDKWYALVMNIDRSKLDKTKKGAVEVINLKLNEDEILHLHKKKGYYPAYHMNKKSWITLVLDDTLKDDEVLLHIEESYGFSSMGKKKNRSLLKNEWLVPANPQYFDIVGAFRTQDEIIWKQSADVKAGDIAYMYVGAPVSAVLYRCLVTEVDIPYNYADKNIKINKVMKIKRLQSYAPDMLTFAKLKSFGVNAVRGPRGLPEELSQWLKEKS